MSDEKKFLQTNNNVVRFARQQKGSGRFIHLDTLENSEERPRPTVWSY